MRDPASPLLLLPSVFISVRVFSKWVGFHIRWPKYWSFSFSLTVSLLDFKFFPWLLKISLSSNGLSFELFVESDYTVPWSLLFWLNMLSTLLKTKTCLYKRHIHEFEVVFCLFLEIPISLKINGKKLFLSISQVLGKKLDGFSDLYCGARLEFRLCFLLWQQFDKCPKLLVKASFLF